jgi:outer membrane protein assembly factor BamD (BamD/ComL family)
VAVNNATPTGNPTEAAGQQDALRAALLKDIPLSPAQKTASNEQLEGAYFALANIYRLKLKEPARAVETYEKLLARFPQSTHAAEVYYTLYLLYRDANDPKQNHYAGLLKKQFPDSRFARLIDQPDYLVKVSAGNMKVRSLYDSAFTLFETQRYAGASQLLSHIRQQYPDSDLMDRVAFLNTRIIGQTESPVSFKTALQQFLTLYPASPLADKAKEYLSAVALYESGKLSEAEFDKTHPPKTRPAAVPQQEAVPAGGQPATGKVTPLLPAGRGDRAPKPKQNPGTQPSEAKQALSLAQEVPKANVPAAPQILDPVSGTGQRAGTRPTAPAADPAAINPPATSPAAAPATPARSTFADVNLQSPQVVVIAYPKGHASFTGITDKVQLYNSKYNAPDKLTTEAGTLNPEQDLVIVREFTNVQKAKIYVSKQKTPQSPLSKIRGIEFATFVVSAENLPALLQAGKLEEYLTFYKNNY